MKIINSIKRLAALGIFLVPALPALAQDKIAELSVDPAVVQLRGPSAVYSLLVTGKAPNGQLVDLTHDAKYRSAHPPVATVSPQGVIRAVADGTTEIIIDAAGKSVKAQ